MPAPQCRQALVGLVLGVRGLDRGLWWLCAQPAEWNISVAGSMKQGPEDKEQVLQQTFAEEGAASTSVSQPGLWARPYPVSWDTKSMHSLL